MMFEENEYLFYYVALVHYWRRQEIRPERYYEIHHVIPKSLGGSDDENNLVSLPAEIHLKVHTLLPLFLTGKAREKMVYAWNMLTNFAGLTDYDEYEQLKKDWSAYTSERMKGHTPWNKGKKTGQIPWNKGKSWSPEMRAKLKQAKRDSDYIPSEETKAKQSKASAGENNPMYGLLGPDHPKYGFKESEETKRRKSEAAKAYIKTEEHKKNIAKSWEERRKKTRTCPHCGFVGCNNMDRYHFDKCKKKPTK